MSPEIDRTHFWLPHRLVLSHLEDGMEYTIHLNFLEEFLVLRVIPDGPRIRWMVSDDDLLQGF